MNLKLTNMNDSFEDKVKTLRDMGFLDDDQVLRKALKQGNNDVCEAVAYLTSQRPIDAMNDQVMESPERNNKMEEKSEQENGADGGDDEQDLVFPLQHLMELEERVFKDSWSIPFKRDESFAKCLMSATRLIKADVYQCDQNCMKFLNDVVEECFNKLLKTQACYKWISDVQEGIYNMTALFIDLLIARLEKAPLPLNLLKILSWVFDPKSQWNEKNSHKHFPKEVWIERLGSEDLIFARPIESEVDYGYNIEYGSMLELINKFYELGGMRKLIAALSYEDDENKIDATHYCAVLEPLSLCVDYINPDLVNANIKPIIEQCSEYINKLTNEQFKISKILDALPQIFTQMKVICAVFWKNETCLVDDLRLSIILKMVQCPNFKAKMTAIREVQKIIDNHQRSHITYDEILPFIGRDKFNEWLSTNDVLSLFLNDHLDNMQYADKVGSLVCFLGDKLSMEELTKLWKLSDAGHHMADSIQNIVGSAACHFNETQLENLYKLVHQSWEEGDERARLQLIAFIGQIGKKTKLFHQTKQVLTLLWDVAHLPKLSNVVVSMALIEQQSVLKEISQSSQSKEKLYTTFIDRCIEDIKNEKWVVPAFNHLYELINDVRKQATYRSKFDRHILNELQKSHDVIKLAVTSICKSHQLAVQAAKDQKVPLSAEVLVDGRFKHREFMYAHLCFLGFILKEVDHFLTTNRARDMWDTLINNKNACTDDVLHSCDWFSSNIEVLEIDAVRYIFKERLLKIDVVSISRQMFWCFLNFQEVVNIEANKMSKSRNNYVVGDENRGTRVVEKTDLIGMDHLWKICLHCSDPHVALEAMNSLVAFSFANVSKVLKSDAHLLHQQFFNNCYQRLEAVNNHNGMENNGGTVLGTVTTATKTLVASMLPDIQANSAVSQQQKLFNNAGGGGSNKYQLLARILEIMRLYINNVEEKYPLPFEKRLFTPHGQSFPGCPLTVVVHHAEDRGLPLEMEFYANLPLKFLRQQIAAKLNVDDAQRLQLGINQYVFQFESDRYSLEQLGFTERQEMNAKILSSSIDYPSQHDGMLPSQILVKLKKKIYESLLSFSDYDVPTLNLQIRQILLMIPSDPHVRQKIRSIQASEVSSPRKSNGDVAMGGGGDASSSKCTNRRNRDFESLFQLRSPGMNLFRLRYHLEVLSSLLMPVSYDEPEHYDTSFLHAFLHNNGLNTILNVLQKEILSENNQDRDGVNDIETKQGCFSIALGIAKHILCCESVCDNMNSSGGGAYDEPQANSQRHLSASSDAAHSPMKRDVGGSSLEASHVTPIKRNRRSVSKSPLASVLHSPQQASPGLPLVARSLVQLMSTDNFAKLLKNLMQITWKASTGCLHEMNKEALQVETSFSKHSKNQRSNISKDTSSSVITPFSCRNNGDAPHNGQYGPRDSHHIRVQDTTESHVARQALEILVSCLENRSSHIDTFYDQPGIGEFVKDVLIKSHDLAIRNKAVEQFYKLSKIVSKKHPQGHFLKILSKLPLPYWPPSSMMRQGAQSLVQNSLNYFTLQCMLLNDAIENKIDLESNVDHLFDEINWLMEWASDNSPEYFNSTQARQLDNILLTGHLRLITVLLTSPLVDKKVVGERILSHLLHVMLFPGAKLISELSGASFSDQSPAKFMPKCTTDESRAAAYDLITELCRGNHHNMITVTNQLVEMHHPTDLSKIKEFEYTPRTSSRPDHGLVGLKNGGATCYMNSVLQMLFMINDVRLRILSNDLIDIDQSEKGLLYQLQKVFAYLCHSRMKYHKPQTFWDNFYLQGELIGVHQQQDAYEFLSTLMDSVDTFLEKKETPPIFKPTLQLVLTDTKTCQVCQHRTQTEEEWYCMRVSVKWGNLEDAIKACFDSEEIKGENAISCDKCREKRNFMRRASIKSLPDVLFIQLNRFEYDHQLGQSVKFNHYFSISEEINMKPYLSKSIYNTEPTLSPQKNQQNNDMYELAGTVIHRGNANSGHYYSFIKDRRNPKSSTYGNWYKFNDADVDLFQMNRRNFEEECFGGTIPPRHKQANGFDDTRTWNAYLLCYERKKPQQQTSAISVPSSPLTHQVPQQAKKTPLPPHSDDSEDSAVDVNPSSSSQGIANMSQLSNLLKKGEERGVFNLKIPSSIIKLVQEENIHFMKDSGMSGLDYYNFIETLVTINQDILHKNQQISIQSVKLASQFLFNTYFKLRERHDYTGWLEFYSDVLHRSNFACLWLAGFFKSANGSGVFSAYMLECPYDRVREAFCKIVFYLLHSITQNFNQVKRVAYLNPLIEKLISFLKYEAGQRIRNTEHYFRIFAEYSSMGKLACEFLLEKEYLCHLMSFLLGDTASKPIRELAGESPLNLAGESPLHLADEGEGDMYVDPQEDREFPRRWLGHNDFRALHKSVVNLVTNCDVTVLRDVPAPRHEVEDMECDDVINDSNDVTTTKIPMTSSMKCLLDGLMMKRYFRELLLSTNDSDSPVPMSDVQQILLYCCRENHKFSYNIIQLIMNQLPQALHYHDWLQLLLAILNIDDSYRLRRIEDCFERVRNSFLEVLDSSNRNNELLSYHCIKFIVHLSTSSEECNKYLMSISKRWSGSVSWLKRKMNDFGWNTLHHQQHNRSSTSDNSNNISTRSFMRTTSAQHTLDKVTAMLETSSSSSTQQQQKVSSPSSSPHQLF